MARATLGRSLTAPFGSVPYDLQAQRWVAVVAALAALLTALATALGWVDFPDEGTLQALLMLILTAAGAIWAHVGTKAAAAVP